MYTFTFVDGFDRFNLTQEATLRYQMFLRLRQLPLPQTAVASTSAPVVFTPVVTVLPRPSLCASEAARNWTPR